MDIDIELLKSLQDPVSSGVVQIKSFVGGELLSAAQSELHDPARIKWRDNHHTYVNDRELTIIQNHDTYALKLSAGDQSALELIPSIVSVSKKVQRLVNSLSVVFPSLTTWMPDELSMNRYDDPNIGLSFHKDNLRFTGLVAVLALEGQCDLLARSNEWNKPDTLTTEPGDLCLLRASGLLDLDFDYRPEHSVVNLRTPTRTSLMLRANKRPFEQLEGSKFDNWPVA